MDNLNDNILIPELEEPKWKQILKKAIPHIPIALSLVFMIYSFLTVIYYITGPAEGYLHSDCTDSLLWAYATVESGEIIAQDFIYAALLPFSSNLWMIPIIRLFGYTMKAQIISMSIFATLFTVSLIWLFRSLKFSWRFDFLAVGSILMLLSSSVKMREIMWEHVIYYSLALLLINCILSLTLWVIRRWDKYYASANSRNLLLLTVPLILLTTITVGSGTNGVQVLLMTVIPVFAGVFGELFFENKNNLISLDNAGKGASLLILPSCSLLGLVILKKLQGDVEVWYTSYYSNLAGIDSWQDNLFKFHKHYLSLLGFNDANRNIFPDERTENIFTDTAIYNVLAIALFLILVAVPFIGGFFYKKLKNKETKILLISYYTLFFAIMFLFICGNISNVSWRLIPLIGMSAVVIFALINELIFAYKTTKESVSLLEEETEKVTYENRISIRVASLLICVMLVFSVVNLGIIRKMDKDYGKDNYLHKLTDVLIEHDLTYGYATFWYSQAITLLSDSKISCRDVNADAENGVKIYSYQTFNKWYEPQEGIEKYFVLLSGSEYMKVLRNEIWHKWTEEHLIETIEDERIDGFYIFVFDSYLQGIK